jgi:hypothetical protein
MSSFALAERNWDLRESPTYFGPYADPTPVGGPPPGAAAGNPDYPGTTRGFNIFEEPASTAPKSAYERIMENSRASDEGG